MKKLHNKEIIKKKYKKLYKKNWIKHYYKLFYIEKNFHNIENLIKVAWDMKDF